MNLFSGQYLHDIVQELHGPGKFRFIVQPIIAILLGVRDGKLDAEQGKPPYFLHLLTDQKHGPELWKSGIATIAKPLILAWFMDTVFQGLVLGHWNPLQALIVGFTLIALPYTLARGLTNRIVSRKFRSHEYT